MLARGYAREFAEQIYKQILGFGEYGFPESHAASFALLVYVSAWLKHHEPAAFFAALINSQPMGFYAPAQLIREARRQGVEVRAVDVRPAIGTARWSSQRMHGSAVRVAGLVISRQRPATASGVTFVTLEDETGSINLVVWPSIAQAQRRELLGARLLCVIGNVQREGEVLHVVARRLEDYSGMLGGLVARSRDFR
jgi:DNA polymerase III alpha subunit